MRRSFIIIAYFCVHHRFFPAELKLIDCNEDFWMINLHFFLVQTASPILVVGRLVSCKLIWLGLLFKLLLCTVFRNHRSMLHSKCYCSTSMQHYWNLTENFCQITILFPWRKIRCIHQSADIFVKPFFWRNFVNIFLKRILKWTDCWLALPVLEWSGGDWFFSAAVVLNFWCAKFLATLHL